MLAPDTGGIPDTPAFISTFGLGTGMLLGAAVLVAVLLCSFCGGSGAVAFVVLVATVVVVVVASVVAAVVVVVVVWTIMVRSCRTRAVLMSVSLVSYGGRPDMYIFSWVTCATPDSRATYFLLYQYSTFSIKFSSLLLYYPTRHTLAARTLPLY